MTTKNLGLRRGTCESCGDVTGDRCPAYFVTDLYRVTLCTMCSCEVWEYESGRTRSPGQPVKLPGDETIDVTLRLIAERNGGWAPQQSVARQTPEHVTCDVGASRSVSRRRLSQHDWSSQ